jgi:hypothetical protein
MSRETNREIIVGGTSILTARDFLEQLDLTNQGGGEDDDFGSGLGDMMKGAGVEDF